jgi:hypothetical protein
VLNGVEELFGFRECQAQIFEAIAVLLQGDESSDGFFTALIGAQDELEFYTHGGAPPGLHGGGMM